MQILSTIHVISIQIVHVIKWFHLTYLHVLYQFQKPIYMFHIKRPILVQHIRHHLSIDVGKITSTSINCCYQPCPCQIQSQMYSFDSEHNRRLVRVSHTVFVLLVFVSSDTCIKQSLRYTYIFCKIRRRYVQCTCNN